MMKGTTLSFAAASVLLLGCGHQLMQPDGEWPSATPPYRAASKAAPDGAYSDALPFGDIVTSRTKAFDYVYAARTDEPVQRREPGDYVVYRIAATHLPAPVIVTQQVVERRGARLVVDQTIDDGYEPIELRLRILDEPYGSNRIQSVARIEGGVQLPYGSAAYQDLMAALSPPIDQQLGRLGGGRTSVQVGDAIVPCDSTAYRVQVDGRPATMTVLQSLGFAWGDLGGVLRDARGRTIYQAAIVDLAAPRLQPARGMLAAQSEQDDYDSWDELE